MNIIDELKACCKDKSQEAVARELGCSLGTVQRWYRGGNVSEVYKRVLRAYIDQEVNNDTTG